MINLLVRQFGRTVLLLVGISLIVFSLDSLIPGDPAQTLAGMNATAADIERMRQHLGLNRPVVERYLDWAGGAVRGNLGTSLFTSQPVAAEIAARVPVTLSLLLLSLVIGVVAGLATGVVAALYPGTIVDRMLVVIASLGVAMPNFWVGLMLVLLLAVWLPLLPATGYVPLTADPVAWLMHLLLPAFALALAPAAEITRQVRGSVIGLMQRDFVRTAIAKGLPRVLVIGKHVLKNTGVTVATVAGIQVSVLLGSSVVIEQVFGLSGVGSMMLEAVVARDLPVVQGIVLFTTLIILATTLLVELSYGYFNPKVRK